jgi:hypothetical protein
MGTCSQGLGQSVKDRKQTAHQNIYLLLNNFTNVQITETMRWRMVTSLGISTLKVKDFHTSAVCQLPSPFNLLTLSSTRNLKGNTGMWTHIIQTWKMSREPIDKSRIELLRVHFCFSQIFLLSPLNLLQFSCKKLTHLPITLEQLPHKLF